MHPPISASSKICGKKLPAICCVKYVGWAPPVVAFIDSHTGKALEAGFDPNARPEGWAAGKPMAQLPPVSAFAGEIGKSLVRTLDDYASAVAAFSKAIVPAPMSPI